MPQINVIQNCYTELGIVKQIISDEKKENDEPSRTTYSETICYLIREFYSSRKMSEGKKSSDIETPPLVSNYSSGNPVDGKDALSNVISPVVSASFPVFSNDLSQRTKGENVLLAPVVMMSPLPLSNSNEVN